MVKSDTRNTATLAAILARTVTINPNNVPINPADIAAVIVQLTEIARRQESRNVAACNVGLTERQERAERRDRETLTHVCAELGITGRLNHDPRGYSVYLTLPGGESNSFGSEEWGII